MFPLFFRFSVLLYFVCSLTLICMLTDRSSEIRLNPVWMPVSNACQHLCGILNTALVLRTGLHSGYLSFSRRFLFKEESCRTQTVSSSMERLPFSQISDLQPFAF